MFPDYGVDKYDIGSGFGHFGIAVEDVSFHTIYITMLHINLELNDIFSTSFLMKVESYICFHLFSLLNYQNCHEVNFFLSKADSMSMKVFSLENSHRYSKFHRVSSFHSYQEFLFTSIWCAGIKNCRFDKSQRG